ncbi:hypothetical protein PMZ80_005579 [Knufia obscura]|uniref:VASt domain-containing protein n=1 Tax=Knufia obscura TaxID=1635080 RepID=A0ABR0RMY2_9EURO|nr:hypothetical protein PMZ80_005579 [Knufia obscura]
MATASAHSLPLSSPPPSSPPRKRLSKVLTAGRRRSSDVQSDNGASGLKRGSVESIGLHKSPSIQSQRSPSRDGSTRSGGSAGVKKLFPGHAKRERKRIREEELTRIAQEEAARGRQPAPDVPPMTRPDTLNRSHSSLVTVDSEVDSRPALDSRDSHTGYLTTTSPLIKTATVDTNDGIAEQNTAAYSQNASTEQFPSTLEPATAASADTSPMSPAVQKMPAIPTLPGLIDKADTLKPATDPSKERGKSPSRRFKDVFARSGKSPKVSPERRETDSSVAPVPELQKTNTSFSERRLSNNPQARGPSPLRSQTMFVEPAAPKSAMPALQTDVERPQTPPGMILAGPTTTVTPPTPTDHENRKTITASPIQNNTPVPPAEQSASGMQNGTYVPVHRRVRSASGAMGHQKSKLSSSMAPPLTPTIEKVRATTPSGGIPGSRNVSGGGFFSSWMSAAQNAATSITNMTNQNRSRSGTDASEPGKSKLSEEPINGQQTTHPAKEDEMPKKELAVNTLGSGDLDLSHLGIDASNEERGPSPSRTNNGLGEKAEDIAAKMEDILTKRAVSQAYGQSSKSGEATPVAELPDPVTSVRPASTFGTASGTLTPPNGSIHEGESSGVKRTNSVRSRLHNRRSRTSSVTTAQSAIGTMIGASTATLTNPGAGPKLSGFAIAPKPRNRAFHQQFRSVPDDDFLIEDYSCALQKEILLAGRIYISEGHICFSSNILGWVTTLIISFEEIVSIEKENTAIVIPNAIAVQTLHARHTFRSLLSREATYDLMIGIWRVSHPDSFQKSMNGQKLAAGVSSVDNVAQQDEEAEAQASEEDSEEESGSDDDDGSDHSTSSGGSRAGSEYVEAKSLSRKPSGGTAQGPGPTIAGSVAPASGDATTSVAPIVAATDGAQDFPGPATHAPTECTDSTTHYDKIIKDEVIQAPMGKVYSLLYGPQSTTFVRKFLVDGVSKAQDLQLEDDKKGLDNESKSRKYQYIKPLGGSIGPKQTTCITTENLDFFDLEKAVSVTCTTQTPDVPSGSAFSTKTRYCLTWAPGNATRFQMNMTIEWTAKSWLKGPIEKGALDGQQQYGEDLVKTLKGALGRSRAATAGSKVLKGGKKKRKSSKKGTSDSPQPQSRKEEDWGVFDVLRPTLGPIVAPVKPFVTMNMIVSILGIMVLWMWFRGSHLPSTALSRGRLDHTTYYDDLWRREESDLWDWLQDRAGVDGSMIRDKLQDEPSQGKESKQKLKQRQKLLKSKDMQTKLREEKRSMKEMEEAVRVTQERLESLQKALERQKDNP